MPASSILQESFNAGELSPLVAARVSFNKRESGAETLQNYLATIQGPAIRRPGTPHVAAVKTSAKKTRIVPFEFSTEQAYIIEVGDQYMRFYKNNGQIQSMGSPYEIATPYLEADIFDLQFTQSADVMFIVHEDYAPRELTRTSDTAWALTATAFKDGPYLPLNIETTTLVASAATGSVTVTASAVTGINDDQGFLSTDVGRKLRIANAGVWAWGTITARADTTHVTVTVESGSFPTVATVNWRLGLFSGTTGYPATVSFYQDRLFYGGTVIRPQRVDGSRTGDYNNFAPSDPDGTVADDHAVSTTINTNTVNRTQWLIDQDKGLAVGTTGGEFLLRPSNLNEAISPTNIKADRATPHGCASIQPIRAGSAALYVQRSQRKVREMMYSIESDNYRSSDLTRLANHITKTGVIALAYQQEPYSIVWAVRTDGLLLGFTYERDEEVLAWHRHPVGGVSDASGNPAKVESIACIPSPAGDYTQLWMVVQRYINGSSVRYIEYLAPYREADDALEDAFYVDSGLTYDGAAATTITGLGHLEGETVTILADGALVPEQVVAGGQITLTAAASKVHVGLSYQSDLVTMSIEAGSYAGHTPVGKTKRIHYVTMKVLGMLGLKLGPDEAGLREHVFRKTSDPMGSAPPLFSGDIPVNWEGDYVTQAKIHIRQEGPFPGTISALVPHLVGYDR